MAPSTWRLALDVAPLRARPAGVGIYVRNLALALAARLPGQLTLIGARPDADLAAAALAGVARVPFRTQHYHAWLQVEAERAARRRRADLVHYTNAGAPLLGSRPFVLTVHDLSVVRLPRQHPWLRLATVPITLAAIAAARRIIVPSSFTGDEVTRLLGVAGDRVVVVEHAATPLAAQAADAAAGADADMTLARLGLVPGGYLLALGTVEPRKNLVRLIAAFEQLVAGGHDLRLVICGEQGWHAGALLRRIEASPLRERISRLGYVADRELLALIRGSAAVCYVSLYEGYGLPVIDAMAVGAAVVTSRVASMPQVAGGAAVLVDPYDVDDIARGISEALARRSELTSAGLARAAARTWADVARETIAVYEQALTH